MSYQGYVVAAYAIFAVALLWDLAVPILQVRRQRRAARLRVARRQASASASAPSTPLLRD